MDDRFVFCKVTWMRDYRGEPHEDTRYRNIMNYRRGDDYEGAEAHLFEVYRGKCYGYVHLGRMNPRDDDTIRTINLRQLGGRVHSDLVRGIHVVWIAARLDGPGVCVVGEYRDADVYRVSQDSIGNRRWGWNISASAENVSVIPDVGRLKLDGVPLRQGNLWYAKGSGDASIRRAAKAHLDRLGVAITRPDTRGLRVRRHARQPVR